METKNRWKSRFRSPVSAFYAISAVGILSFFLISLRYGSAAYTWVIQENNPNIRFSDYFWHLAQTVDRSHLYQNISWDAAGCFPPLAYCMYYLLYKFTRPLDMIPRDLAQTEQIPGAMLIFIYYLLFSSLLLLAAVSITGRKSRKRDAVIFSLLMFSAVFFGSAIPSGNSAVLVLSLLLTALHLKDTESAWKRELGLILLAVCVALKLYPAVFGLLYLKEKRYRELLRLMVCSAALLFLPFVFFGGYPGFRHWLLHIMNTMGYSDLYRLQYFRGIFHTILFRFFGRERPLVTMALTLGAAGVLAWNAWRSRNLYRTLFFLITIMCFFPANVYRYTLCYFSIPLIMGLKESGEKRRGWCSWPVMTLYGLLFTIPSWWLLVIPMEKRYPYETLTGVELYLYLIVYALIGVVLVIEWADRLIRTREAHKPWIFAL